MAIVLWHFVIISIWGKRNKIQVHPPMKLEQWWYFHWCFHWQQSHQILTVRYNLGSVFLSSISKNAQLSHRILFQSLWYYHCHCGLMKWLREGAGCSNEQLRWGFLCAWLSLVLAFASSLPARRNTTKPPVLTQPWIPAQVRCSAQEKGAEWKTDGFEFTQNCPYN